MNQTYTKYFLLILVMLLSSVSTINAQNCKIEGHVVDSKDKKVLPGSTIFIDQINESTITNSSGEFILSALEKGIYQIHISCVGYHAFNTKLSLDSILELKIELQANSISLAEVKVDANRSFKNQKTISDIDIMSKPVNTSQDLLKLVPGLFIAQHAGGGKAEQIFFRGFDADHGTDLLITTDGVPVNIVSHAHGQGYADLHFIIPETIDRLKVYKGPFEAKFGDFATSGTAEFSTKNKIDKSQIKTEIGMYDTYRTAGIINLLDPEKSGLKHNLYLATEYVYSDSYFENPQGLNRFNLMSKYTGPLNDRNYLTLSISTFHAKWNASGQIPNRIVESGSTGRFGSVDPTEGGKTQRSNINIIHTKNSKNEALIKNQFYFTDYKFNLYSNFTFFLNDSIHGDEINQRDDRNIFGYKTSIFKDNIIAGKLVKTEMGFGTRNDFSNISLFHSESQFILDTITIGNLYQQNADLFLNFDIKLSKKLNLTLGVRLDYFIFSFHSLKNNSKVNSKSQFSVSPKLNMYYSLNENRQLFFKSGIGFHSNDARSIIQNQVGNNLPKAYSAETGIENKIGNALILHTSIWYLYLQNELVYTGDEGTVELKNPTQRMGADLSIRLLLNRYLSADFDINYSHGRIKNLPDKNNYIPLAPDLTSVAGISYRKEKGLNASLHYRYIADRPANENNTVVAKGYFLLDLTTNYKFKNCDLGISVENLLNSNWNEAQFDTESRLREEILPVSELHFTPGTPLYLKANFTYFF